MEIASSATRPRFYPRSAIYNAQVGQDLPDLRGLLATTRSDHSLFCFGGRSAVGGAKAAAAVPGRHDAEPAVPTRLAMCTRGHGGMRTVKIRRPLGRLCPPYNAAKLTRSSASAGAAGRR